MNSSDIIILSDKYIIAMEPMIRDMSIIVPNIKHIDLNNAIIAIIINVDIIRDNIAGLSNGI